MGIAEIVPAHTFNFSKDDAVYWRKDIDDGEGPYTKRWTEEMFWRCFSMAGITAFEGPKPRVYDFRHTFATECICRWMREGRDIDAMLPFLSAYMGHARYEDTLYYVHILLSLV